MKNETEISKFLSYVLRHQPEAIDLTLDREGWASIDELIAGATQKGYGLDKERLLSVVKNSEKQRFTLSEDGLRIRAAQGHSTAKVDIAYRESTPPDILYHGTATRFLTSIREQGLLPKQRQYVHLSADSATARQVGQRYGEAVILQINALAMSQQGYPFFQADNGVWLTASVPAAFLAES